MGRRGRNGSRWMTFEYDFATLGGTVGAKTLTAPNGEAQRIPDNAVVLDWYLEPVVAPTSGGAATISIEVADSDVGELLTATAFDAASLAPAAANLESGIGIMEKLHNASGAAVTATIAGAALTAGRFLVHVKFRDGV